MKEPELREAFNLLAKAQDGLPLESQDMSIRTADLITMIQQEKKRLQAKQNQKMEAESRRRH